MNPTQELKGIVTVLNTPFTADNRIDEASLQRHVDYAIDAGVNGFLVPAMAAEAYKLSFDERLSMLSCVLETVAGKLPVVAGVYAADSPSRIALAQDYLKCGATIILASIPFESEKQFIDDVTSLASAGMDVLMLQDWSPNDYGLPLELIERLAAQIPAFRSIKIEVATSGIKYSDVLERTGGQLHVAGGWAVTQMIEGLDRGIHAFMPTGLHEIYVEIYRRYKNGDRSGARDLHYRILPVLAFSNQHLDISIHFFKQLLHRQGVYTTAAVREPIIRFDRYHQQMADSLIDYALALIETVKASR